MKKITLLFCVLLTFSTGILLSCSDNDEVVPSKKINFSVTPTEIDFDSEGGNTLLNITTNTNWEITSDAEWISIDNKKGAVSKKVNLTVTKNENAEGRNTSLTVQSGEHSQAITISQEAGEEPFVITYDVEPDHSTISELSAVEFAKQITVGWNLGNTLEAIGGETKWGNPKTSQQLIDSVHAAGFDAIRIPVAWSKFSNEENYTIQDSWMSRVEEVVNYALSNDMYVVMNIHWDGGWMQPTYDQQDYVNDRLAKMWKQIATHFRDYDDHLLFAGTNEVMVEDDYSTPTNEYYTVQNSFNQTFVNTVRATGGKNAYRYLVVQGFNTNIDHTVNFATIPEDVVENRLMMEVHYYDPYDFALNKTSGTTQWGQNATDPSKTDSWGQEDYVDQQFQKMKTNFIDEGVAVILGEYGALSKPNAPEHAEYRKYYIDYVTEAAQEDGLVPFYWDNGDQEVGGFALFDRNNGETVEPEIVEAIMN